MGIYYSSVDTRLKNVMRDNDLILQDFAVLNPCFIRYCHNCGHKSEQAIRDALQKEGMLPGEYEGEPKMSYYNVIKYYKEHREELQKKYPIKYINKQEEPKADDWAAFRKEVAKEILLKLSTMGSTQECVDGHSYYSYRTFVPFYTPEAAAEYAVSAANALIEKLK